MSNIRTLLKSTDIFCVSMRLGAGPRTRGLGPGGLINPQKSEKF